MTEDTSPMAEAPPPPPFPELPPVAGVRLATHAAGLRYQRRADLMLAAVVDQTTVAGTFTRSRCPSAPVVWCRRILGGGRARAIVCNAGNANAFTGRAGETDTEATATTLAGLLGAPAEEIYVSSTGVIGETLPIDALTAALPTLVAGLATPTPDAWEAAARAIGTTDTFPKGAAASFGVGGGDPGAGPLSASVVGIAKGSGMIAPDMATMLAYVFTDLPVAAPVAQAALSAAVDASFNSVSVDSDTSTSDTVLLFATGALDVAPIESFDDPRYPGFAAAVGEVTLRLAHQIVRDGEGATKFVEVVVRGAAGQAAARTIAFAIGNSPLVKTALAAEDANWGRIVMAVGKAGEEADRDALAIWIGDEQCAAKGVQAPGYSEERATVHLRNHEVRITADVGIGDGAATIWTCDLTHGYIDINAGYRS
ncbi:MAG: bifunctional glutamate N-acetyltransferase/amino-acid acetyltransferase ArgJ [Actinomycetota bacterium]|nr:bifunctional glutamate N-acetyltransferase/amino-acid acetyltransferase ArgJ [Actinomycetota bacterium]